MSNKPQPSGCLGIIFKLLGISPAGDPSEAGGTGTAMPYRLRDKFLSPAELAFHIVLTQAVGDRYSINNKVRLWDVIYVPRSEDRRKFENKISSKHLDFLLCDPTTMQPVLAIELDDASHARPDRQQRDQFVDNALAAAGLPILHVPAARTYSIAEVQSQIEHLIPIQSPTAPTKPPPIPASGSTPKCPKCTTPMVQREAAKGKHAGKRFWACNNYPKCREIIGID